MVCGKSGLTSTACEERKIVGGPLLKMLLTYLKNLKSSTLESKDLALPEGTKERHFLSTDNSSSDKDLLNKLITDVSFEI